ncbi:Uncharacterized protein FWK35_00010263 [Aphis craccivora]|uniref:Uncharacterized protein n=1 Tax=Aphis craccivora TaxID=307492 RepID=A0A6G0Z667_APHCR|nr:Uncharacterized protein FWK35_00010263 [Aphis craccivora]
MRTVPFNTISDLINSIIEWNKIFVLYYDFQLSRNTTENNSERSEECIDFTMIITSRNNAPISNYGGGFRCKSEYPWCIIEVKS